MRFEGGADGRRPFLVHPDRVSYTALMRQVRRCPTLVLLTTSLASTGQFTGTVVGVSDGDTLTVLSAGKTVEVRLADIDCPETGQPFSQRAPGRSWAAA